MRIFPPILHVLFLYGTKPILSLYNTQSNITCVFTKSLETKETTESVSFK